MSLHKICLNLAFLLVLQTSLPAQSGGPDFFFTQNPRQQNPGATGFEIAWQTNLPASCQIRLSDGVSPEVVMTVPGTAGEQGFVCSGLQPGTIYWISVEAQYAGKTIRTEPRPFVTNSLSSGQIKTYFNHGIDPAFANGYQPDGVTVDAVLNETLARINAAQQTLDVAMYNCTRSDLLNAVKAAHARGVRVRYVTSASTSNTALEPPPDFPVVYGNNTALMHNKFLVIDADLPDQAWVMGGSMNWTYQNTEDDFNNTVFIQDQSLARAYELEFEEMWGSSGALPNLSASRFGETKLDNTPHQFVIGGHAVELYFSPSDQTTSRIEAALRNAQSELLFGTFSFTKNELGNAVLDAHEAAVPTRGIIENIGDNGAEYAYLLDNGVNVRHHNLPGDMHHKYAIVDAYDTLSDPTVVTGSHNWTFAAETANDENTLVLHHPGLAALFKAEFEKRWGEFPASASAEAGGSQGFSVFPNPARELLWLRDLPSTEDFLWVKNALGQTLRSLPHPVGQIDISGLPAGPYFLIFVSKNGFVSVPFQKI